MNFNRLKHIRQQVYASFERETDALFNLGDALLCGSQAQSLPIWSLSPYFERQWPSVSEALEDRRITVEQIRALWVILLADRWYGTAKFLRTCYEPGYSVLIQLISRWNHLPFQQDRELDLSVISVEREAATGTKRDPRVRWLVMLDEIVR